MAGNQFLKIDGIDGESEETGFEKTLEILSWSMGAMNAGSSGIGTGMGTSNVQFQDFNFTIQMGSSDPALILATANGKHFASAILTCLKPTGDGLQSKFLEFTFTDLVFNSYSTSGANEAGVPLTNLSFNFTQIEQEYFAQNAKGSLESKGKTGWNVKTNKNT